jgi:hypothetical protein
VGVTTAVAERSFSYQHQSPYYYHFQREFDVLLPHLRGPDRKILFIFGLGFDPRCVPAYRVLATEFPSMKGTLVTVCARFTNLFDEELKTNMRWTYECLDQIRYITSSLSEDRCRHFEVEVNMFDSDRRQVGDSRLIAEVWDCLGREINSFTDVIVDVSAFPRTLMFALLSRLWTERPYHQNLYAVLTEGGPTASRHEERDFIEPKVIRRGEEADPPAGSLWVPVLGGSMERLARIYDQLQPADVFPIIPFPSKNPRYGDDVLLEARRWLFDEWGVRYENVLYASGDVAFDIFRKITDIVHSFGGLTTDHPLVLSALSGRALSLGVLLAALWNGLYLCHVQPTTYSMTPTTRNRLIQLCASARPTVVWLDGAIYA